MAALVSAHVGSLYMYEEEIGALSEERERERERCGGCISCVVRVCERGRAACGERV